MSLVAVVLAAGAGMRLRPLTDLRPKPLCPVGGTPLIDLAIARALPHTQEIAVNVSHGRAQMEEHLSGTVHLSIEEPAPLGTAGAIVRLRDWIAGRDVLVLNADAWLPAGVAPLLAGWQRDRLRLLTVEDRARADFGPLRFAGASLMPWDVVASLPAGPGGLYEVCWRPLLDRSRAELVTGDGPFFDCGTPQDYHAANMAASGGRNVVGAGAMVEGEIERTVVWDGARVERGERLRDAVRADGGVTVVVGS